MTAFPPLSGSINQAFILINFNFKKAQFVLFYKTVQVCLVGMGLGLQLTIIFIVD